MASNHGTRRHPFPCANAYFLYKNIIKEFRKVIKSGMENEFPISFLPIPWDFATEVFATDG